MEEEERRERFLAFAEGYPFWPAPGSKPRRMDLVWRGLVLAALAALVYMRVILTGALIWQDEATLDRLWSWGALARMWTPAFGTYRPLALLLLWTEHHFIGLTPLPYHCVSVALHAANCVLLWLILRRLDVRGAWLAAALFAVHPVEVQSVAWISQQSHLLGATFILFAVWLYLRMSKIMPPIPADYLMWIGKRGDEPQRLSFSPGTYAVTLTLAVAAVLSDPVGLTLPIILTLIIWWKRVRMTRADWNWLKPFYAIALVGLVLDVVMALRAHGSFSLAPQLSIAFRALLAGQAISFYAINIVRLFPRPFVYPRFGIPGLIVYGLATLIGLIGCIILWADRARRGIGPTILALIFVAMLLPALADFLWVSAPSIYVADHLQYLAATVPLILIALAVSYLVSRYSTQSRQRVVRVVLAIAFIGVFALFSVLQNHVYTSAKTAWESALKQDPQNVVARSEFALVLKNEDPDRALEVLGEAGPKAATDLTLLDTTAKVLMAQERFDEAISQYLIAERLAPDNLQIQLGLADAYEAAGNQDLADDRPQDASEKYHDALAVCEVALRLDNKSADVHDRLGKVMVRQGRLNEGLDQFNKALGLNRDYTPARVHRADALFKIGMQGDEQKLNQANLELQDVFLTAPNEFEAYLVAASWQYQMSEFSKAEKYYRSAVQTNPTSVEAWTDLGVTQCDQRQYKAAIWSFDHALKLKHDSERALSGKRLALANVEDHADAPKE